MAVRETSGKEEKTMKKIVLALAAIVCGTLAFFYPSYDNGVWRDDIITEYPYEVHVQDVEILGLVAVFLGIIALMVAYHKYRTSRRKIRRGWRGIIMPVVILAICTWVCTSEWIATISGPSTSLSYPLGNFAVMIIVFTSFSTMVGSFRR